MLVATREDDRRCKPPLLRRALVVLVHLPRHDPLARVAAGFGMPVGAARAHATAVTGLLADRAYQGAGPWVTTGLKRPPGGELTLTQRTVDRTPAVARAPVERGMARLKPWQIFRRSRISPNRMTVIAKAVLTLQRQRGKRSLFRTFPHQGSA
ncbi:hypothetical protein IPZ64_02400 [Streptomyces violaceoruber]|uniref:transposase family protein n=1 Tax=Streptomyces violaceoruber TaxID=1935 RepID=UPI001F1DA4ED|nr:transposase family protein [Streptomyces violaceoruber]MCF3165786.1 hypothetical protein [Streptomyces violaceoruber]